MATIGGNTVSVYKGQLLLAEPAALLYRAPGVMDPGSVYGAWQVREPALLETMTAVADLATAVALMNAYRNLCKTFVTIVDPIGFTWVNCEVLTVQLVTIQTLLSVYVLARWQVMPAATAPS